MRESKKIKQVAMGVVSLIFVITAYVTFFKAPPKNRPPLPGPPAQGSQELDGPEQGPDIKIPDTVVMAILPNGKATKVFQPTIRDIFQVPRAMEMASSQKASPPKAASQSRAETEIPLSNQERDAIKTALVFKGAILHGSRSVAIINHSFFHIGDRINGYQVISISEKEVKIASSRGKITLEILKYD